MRLFKQPQRRGKSRKGVSFIELVSSIVVITMICASVIYAGDIVVKSSKDITYYTRLRAYATNKIEEIENDLESGTDITSKDYSENGITSGVHATVEVSDVGFAFGDSVYVVKMRLILRGTDIVIQPKAILRGGCSLYAEESP